MKGIMFANDIQKLTKENTNFRKVIYTGEYSQIVLMSIPAHEDIGEEVHNATDQTFVFVHGEGEAIVNGEVREIEEGDMVFIPAGTKHNFKNTNNEDLKLFTMYAPPQHQDGTIHRTKKDAQEK